MTRRDQHEFKLEMDPHGRLVLTAPDGQRGLAIYETIASVKYEGEYYIAVTEYFEGCLPTNQIVKITPIGVKAVPVNRPLVEKGKGIL